MQSTTNQQMANVHAGSAKEHQLQTIISGVGIHTTMWNKQNYNMVIGDGLICLSFEEEEEVYLLKQFY